jgi:hypothetical protein
MALKALLCFGNDALLHHRSVLRAIHPLNPPKIISACLGGRHPLSKDNGSGHKASCATLGGRFRRQQMWLAIVVIVVVGW